jgi:hypothetical protein
MESDFFIAYALRSPTAEMAIVLDQMKSLRVFDGGTFFAWLVRTDSNAPAIRERLGPLVGYGGYLFVIEVKDASMWVPGNVNPIDQFRQMFE